MNVKKAVFPVAGLGTRFLPATKASPKEMLTIVDKPLIQYAVEEAVAAGIDTLIFITGRTKRAIVDHFDTAYELETELELKGKADALAIVRDILPPGVSCINIRQSKALGLGHAVACARPVIGDEPFAVILADDLIDGAGKGALAQMVKAYNYHRVSVLGVERVPEDEVYKYGIVDTAPVADRLGKVNQIVEKPKPEDAPSNLAVVGRYILTPQIFDRIAALKPGAGGEYQLTDAIADLLNEQQVLAYEFDGKRYDCGAKMGYLQAIVEYGLKHPELQGQFRDYLRDEVPKLI
jgi:UTP--glucose-1-phosphate uridylyltransferase